MLHNIPSFTGIPPNFLLGKCTQNTNLSTQVGQMAQSFIARAYFNTLKIFFLFFITFYHTPITFLTNTKVKPGAHSSEILPVLLKSQAIISAWLTGNVTFPLVALAVQTCSPLFPAAKWLPGVWLVIRAHHPTQLDSSTACFSVPVVLCGYLGEFLNTLFKNAKPVWTDNSDIRQLP